MIPAIRTSFDDVAALAQHNLVPETVVSKLLDIVERAVKVYQLVKNNRKDFSFSTIIDGKFKVTMPSERLNVTFNCAFCDRKTRRPGKYTIENLGTGATLEMDELTWHQVRVHQYFGRKEYRFDPIKACEVIGLI